MNNCRAIAVSTAMSKLFKSVIADKITTASPADKYQFGFKSGHSTGLCILKRTINYYASRGSHAFL